MLILRQLRTFTLIISLSSNLPWIACDSDRHDVGTSKSTSVAPDDTETKLLDQEYGVRYASACEGKTIASNSFDVIHLLLVLIKFQFDTNLILFSFSV